MPGKALWGLQFTKNRWQSYRLPWVSGSAHITTLPQTLKSLERSSAVNYCRLQAAGEPFFTRSINHFTMGWFGAGYPNKHQWNGIWWVVCDRLGQEKGGRNGGTGSREKTPSSRRSSGIEVGLFLGLRVRLRQGARLRGRPPAACAGKLAGKLCGQAFKSAFDKVRARGA